MRILPASSWRAPSCEGGARGGQNAPLPKTTGEYAAVVNSPGKIAEDDYVAKIRCWAANPQVVPLPPGLKIPHFSPKKFNSHAEMNAWKEELIRQMAANPRG